MIRVLFICSVEKAGNAPHDHATLVVQCYTCSQVMPFYNLMRAIEAKLLIDATAYTWKQILKDAMKHYLLLQNHWHPNGKNTAARHAATKTEFSHFIKATDKRINALKLQNGNGNDNGNSNNTDSSKWYCYDCNKKGVKKGHKGCPSPGSGIFNPNKKNNDNGNDNTFK